MRRLVVAAATAAATLGTLGLTATAQAQPATLRALAITGPASAGIVVLAYRDEPVGTMIEDADGSGGGDTTAINEAVTHMLTDMRSHPAFPQYFASLPIMAVDGSLAFVTDFESDSTLAPAKGQVHAKPGSFIGETPEGLYIRGQAFGGYIQAKSGKKLVYQLVVNGVPFRDLNDLLQVFQDQGTISAMLWRDN